ncbi:mannitol dehydrogenase family protein [Yoonia sp. I 8.24]|uniref:mannitol dehydrogenase family protein n=1 Tax=Yoonia sp. I 8.24 TaxID=1537229 RepID=UPI001EDD158D|nr:mannitol dehydrogenase family protein [Yoonia sp. I 8.24]MCG3268312.1 mannitol dehydrogenase family protein [Yoonia sp. I 8.24]
MEAGLPANPTLIRSNAPRPKVGIVHLGPGAFFRAFGAPFTSEAVAQSGGDWGILTVSLRSPDIRDRLKPQDCAYTSVTLAPDGAEYAVVEVINDILVAPENPPAVLDAMADPAVKIVSLTITEKGYCSNPATGGLLLDHPDIAHDLAHPSTPKSAIGYIFHALNLRRLAGVAPFTVLSCDNLPNNGPLTRAVVLDFARAFDTDLARWIAINCRFPATMVDRITPATTQADIDALAAAQGYVDNACVMHEPFRQWVITDDFVDGERPDWGAVGAQLVSDVETFELMKLRCLNGTHSALAYLGYLAGHETISETVADPDFARFIKTLWEDEIIPTLPQPEGEDLNAYAQSLLTRYQNPAIRHKTWQIAMDGSQKLPQRLLGTIADNLDAGRDIAGLSLAVAGWMRYVGGVDEKGAPIDVKDPLVAQLRAAYEGHDTPESKVAALLAIRDVFPADLAKNATFRAAVTGAFTQLSANGARATVQGMV